MALLAICVTSSARAGQEFELRTISSRPETVSGGDVLVRLIAPSHSRWIVELNDRDVTRSFRPAGGAGSQVGLLTGLRLGENTLQIRANGGIRSKLEIVNHARVGPIFSGPHQEPFICQTVDNGLGPALDADCSANTVVQYYYKSTKSAKELSLQTNAAAVGALGPGFKTYDPSAAFPSDVAQTVTSEGRTVSYIVRREIGTINRAVYEIQLLHQPGRPLPSPWARQSPGWNGRLVYSFGAGCAAGYHQGMLDGHLGVNPAPLLALGYAFATSTLNIFENNCNDQVSAETLSMVKEYFIKRFGEPVHTIGKGGSGGAMQSHLIAQNYPGLLDGIIVGSSFPDILTYVPPVTDCALLRHAFESSKERWTEEQKTAVSGFATWNTCGNWAILDPKNCDRSIPKEMVYDGIANPHGVRCDIYSNYINILGPDPRTGLARRPLDNVGVQYGLAAFNSGKIDAEQFVDLNERTGGYDENGSIVPTRMEAEPEALRLAYERGLVLTGGGGLSQIPIMNLHWYTDDQGDEHDRLRAFQTRSRLVAANGNADNQIILVSPPYFLPRLSDPEDPYTLEFVKRERDMMQQMDHWLDNIDADSAATATSAKVARNRPTELAEGCWQVDGNRIIERATYDGSSKCNEIYPPHKDPRLAAGAPVSGDVLKCTLKPINSTDYAQVLPPLQLERLKAVFPSGVCDYNRPGVGQQITKTVWQPYKDEFQIIGQAHPP